MKWEKLSKLRIKFVSTYFLQTVKIIISNKHCDILLFYLASSPLLDFWRDSRCKKTPRVLKYKLISPKIVSKVERKIIIPYQLIFRVWKPDISCVTLTYESNDKSSTRIHAFVLDHSNNNNYIYFTLFGGIWVQL